MSERKTLSVVVPAFNEQELLHEFHKRLADVLNGLDLDSEVVYVNDGSTDDTGLILERLRSADPRVAVVNLSRNFGKEAALTAGLHYARGDAVVVIDADLQDPPELIPEFIRMWRHESADVVYGQRTARDGETRMKKATAHAFYRLMQHFGRIKIPPDTGDFRLMDRRAVDALNEMPETHRFMKGLFTWIGFNQVAVPYRRDRRYAGTTKFNYWRLWNFAIEGFTSYTVVPLQIGSYLGFTIAVAALFYGLYVVVKTLIFGEAVKGYPSLMVAILFMGGVQLIFIGIIGEYLGRVFNETKRRPLYVVKTFDPSSLTAGEQRHSNAGRGTINHFTE